MTGCNLFFFFFEDRSILNDFTIYIFFLFNVQNKEIPFWYGSFQNTVTLFCSCHILAPSMIYYWTDTGQEGIYFFNWHKIPSDTGVETVDVSLTQSLPLLDFYTKNTANSQGPMEKERSPKAFCALLWNLHLEKVSKPWQQEIGFTCKLSY